MMKPLRKIAFGYSTRCNIRCAHCIAADDNTPPVRMEKERAVDLIEELADCRVRGVSFTAGEPLIFLSDLADLLQVCRNRGIYSRVVTNAFWAAAPDRADRTVQTLLESGLSQMRISFSRWHEQHVKRENILHAAAACQKSGLDCFVSLITDFSETDLEREQFLRDHSIRFFPEPMIYSGRARAMDPGRVRTDYQPNTCMMNPYLAPDLNVYACCDAGNRFTRTDFFLLGNVRTDSMASLFDAFENNPLYSLIRTMGLTDIASYLGFPAHEIITYRKCEMCEKLFNAPEVLERIRSEFSGGLSAWKR